MNKTFHLSFDVLLVAGMQSKYLGDTVNIHKQLAPGLCSMIKVEEVSEPEAVLLFCQVVQTGQWALHRIIILNVQGLCLLSAVPARQISTGYDRER